MCNVFGDGIAVANYDVTTHMSNVADRSLSGRGLGFVGFTPAYAGINYAVYARHAVTER